MNKPTTKYLVSYNTKIEGEKYGIATVFNSEYESENEAKNCIKKMKKQDKEYDADYLTKFGTKFGIARRYEILKQYVW
jgi:hypothetical protein